MQSEYQSLKSLYKENRRHKEDDQKHQNLICKLKSHIESDKALASLCVQLVENYKKTILQPAVYVVDRLKKNALKIKGGAHDHTERQICFVCQDEFHEEGDEQAIASCTSNTPHLLHKQCILAVSANPVYRDTCSLCKLPLSDEALQIIKQHNTVDTLLHRIGSRIGGVAEAVLHPHNWNRTMTVASTVYLVYACLLLADANNRVESLNSFMLEGDYRHNPELLVRETIPLEALANPTTVCCALTYLLANMFVTLENGGRHM